MLDIGCWMLVAGCSMLDVRCAIRDARCSVLDAWCSAVYMRFMMVKIRIRIMRVIRSHRTGLIDFKVKDSLTSLIFSTGMRFSV